MGKFQMSEIHNNLKEFGNERKMIELFFTWVKEQFSGFRLLWICIFFFIAGVILLFKETQNISKPFPTNSILYGLGFGIVIGILTILNFSRHIIGRFYYLYSLSLRKLLYVIIVSILLSYTLIFTANILKSGFYKYIILPCFIAIPVGALISIIWLINYEKIHGMVFIVKKGNK